VTEADLSELMTKVADDMIEVYGLHCNHAPKVFILTAMAGALSACASEAGVDCKMIVAVLNSAFDDIEAGEK
jgi:hypothetical protein